MLGLYHVCILQVCKDPSMELANFIFFGSLHGSVAYASIDELLPKARVVDKNLFPSCEVLFRVPKTGRIFGFAPRASPNLTGQVGATPHLH